MKTSIHIFRFATLLLFNFSVGAFAQTNVSGLISSSTTWNINGSPYIVVGNLLVVHGATLTIEPGVVAKFESDKALQIDGELIAIGTPQDSITFTSNQANPAKGDWSRIQFTDSSVDAVLNSAGQYISGSSMQYCSVSYGGAGTTAGSAELSMSFCSPYFAYCTISESLMDGIYGIASSSNIDYCTVKNCDHYGIDMHSMNSSSICNNLIVHNTYGGVYINGSNDPSSKLNIKNNYFSENDFNGALLMIWCERAVNIIENVFVNNTATEWPILARMDGMYSDTIACNRFIDNSVSTVNGQDIMAVNTGPGHGIVMNNYFENNTCINGGQIARAYLSSTQNSASGFENNYFINNHADFVCKITVGSGTQTNSNITHNTIINNTSYADFSLSASTNSNLNFKFNNFPDPLNKIKLYNSTSYGVTSYNVDSNYWYGTSSTYLDSVIYDFFDDSNLSVVYVNQVLSSQTPVDTSCSFLSTGIGTLPEQNSFLLFPNPAQNMLTLHLYSTLENGTLSIFNLLGEECYRKKIHRDSELNVNISRLIPGIYVVRLQNGINSVSKKLIVE